jgi:hypothetical protein
VDLRELTMTSPITKKCLNCGYELQLKDESELDPLSECPKCQAIYRNVERLLSEKERKKKLAEEHQQKSSREIPIESTASKPFNKKLYLNVILIILVVFFVGFAYRYVNNHFLDGDLNGEIFIVTGGGENIRLGLVEVKLIPENSIPKFMQLKVHELDIAMTNINKKLEEFNMLSWQASDFNLLSRKFNLRSEINRDVNYINSGKFLFDELPKETVKTKTDADGKFTLQLKRGTRMALAAHGRRDAQDEDYYWLIWVSLEGKSNKRIILSNDNIVEANVPESILPVMKFPHI